MQEGKVKAEEPNLFLLLVTRGKKQSPPQKRKIRE